MGKSKEIRKRTLLERLAAQTAAASEREKILSAAVTKLRSALIVFAKGENWAIRKQKRGFLKTISFIVWTGEGSPEGLATATIAAVFGKNHPLTEEVVHLQGQGEPQHE